MTTDSGGDGGQRAPRIQRDDVVPVKLSGLRIDQAAVALWPEFSRAMHGRWLRSGDLRLDGSAAPPKTRVYGGERLTLSTSGMLEEAWHAPQEIAFAVVYEDEHLLVVNKPVGLVTHPGAGNLDQTLVNGLLAHRAELAHLPRAGIVHRLDKDTSGLLLVAATEAAHTTLVQAMQSREIQRSYVAVTEGTLAQSQRIDQPIGRDPRQRLRQKVLASGKRAVTRVEKQENWICHSLVRAHLETGRTHQIRVHLAHIGHPLVGDSRYGARGRVHPGMAEEVLNLARNFPRQALHAQYLALIHPDSGEQLALEAEPPKDLAELIAALRGDAQASREQ